MSYDYGTILAHLDEYQKTRVRFSDVETGWAYILDDTHGCLANLPASTGLLLYDIVTLDDTDEDLPRVDEVIQRYYATQVGLQYAADHAEVQRDVEGCKRRFERISRAAAQAGCALEGLLPGLAMLNAPAGFSLASFIESVGLDPAWVHMYEQV